VLLTEAVSFSGTSVNIYLNLIFHHLEIKATEMRYLRSVKGCTKLDHIKNEHIRKKLDIDSTQYKIENYRKKWTEHLERMPDERIPKQILKYKPKGRLDQGRPWKRWNE
jgi:hypothetical protein